MSSRELERAIRLVAEILCEAEEMRAYLANAGIDTRTAQVEFEGIVTRAA